MTTTDNPPPAYIRSACPVCGATTDAEAETRCKVERDYTDEYQCKGGAQDFYDGPRDGFLYFPNPAMSAWVDRQLDARRASHPEEFQ